MKKLLFILLTVMSTAVVMAEENVTAPTTTSDVAYLWRDGCKIYQGEQLLTQQEYKNLLKNTCPEAFARYDKGTKIANAGWGLMGAAGVLMFGVAIPVLYAPNPIEVPDFPGIDASPEALDEYWTLEHKRHSYGDAKLGAFIGLLSTHCVLLATSVPLISVGYSMRHKSLTTYNQQCLRQEPAITYSLTAGQNGIGFAVNF